MRKRLLIVLCAALATLIFAVPALATAYHTITIDGDLSDWAADEMMETDNGRDLYITWDDTNLYIGLDLDTGEYLGDDGGNKSLFVAIDTDLADGSGAGSDGYSRVNFTGSNQPEVFYAFAGGAGYYEWASWNGASWDWQGWSNTGTYYDWDGSSAAMPGDELTIPLANLGNPDAIAVFAWVTPEGNSNIDSSWPTPNPTGSSPNFVHAYHLASLIDGPAPDRSVLADHVIINELDNYSEWVELYNPTDSAVDISGWVLEADYDSLDYTIPATTILAPGDYYTYTTSGDLNNGGDVINLYNDSAALIDQVGYGNHGGAPAPSTIVRTVARVPNGTDSDDDARDWNLTTTPTERAANDVPHVLLGSSLILNEFDNYPASGGDKVEIFNPTADTITLTGWLLSDGDAVASIVTSVSVDPGGWLVLEEGIDWTVSMDFSSSDVGYLFLPNGIRVDQLGWAGEYEDDTFQRVLDGQGPNDGYDWASSGGDFSLYDFPSTLGATNVYHIQPGGVLINEFVATPTSAEAIELYNPLLFDIDVSGWTIDWVYGSTTITTGQVVAAGDYLVLTNDNTGGISVSNDGTVLSLITGTLTVDSVGYGDDGGAPKPIYNFSAARVPNGTDTGDDAADFNLDTSPTLGYANDGAAADLGGSPIRINEIMPDGDPYGSAEGVAFIEFFNDSESPVDIGGYMLQVDDDYYFAGGTVIAAHGFYTVSGTTISGGASFFTLDDDGDNMYLYDATGARIDQIGWDSRTDVVTNGESFQRVPDGAPPYDGYNWANSGGNVTLFQIPPSEGVTNGQAISGLLIEKQAPSLVSVGEAFTYTLTVMNQTAQTLSDLWISDTLPLSVTYASSDPMGSWDDATHTITWTESTSVTHGSTLTYTVVVTAPAAMTTVTNTDYTVWSSDWTTPTVGDPVVTAIRDCNTIYGIQYTTDAGSGTYPSPCEGEAVTVQGIVYAVYGSNYFIADGAGPWHGIYIYSGGDVEIGDEVELSGHVSEYYGVTELAFPSLTILSSGNAIYGPSVVTADQIPYNDPDVSEGYEGVFVETRDITVTVAANSYGIWAFTDASGATGKADDWGYDADPSAGDAFAVLRGPLAYDYSEYKIMPRDADDALEKGIIIDKDAPASVETGDTFTYTLTVVNRMGFTLNDVIVTDTVPAGTTFAYALDGGGEAGGVVSWTVSSMAYMDQVDLRFVVTATSTGGIIINDDYAVSAANYVTPTFGAPVNTAIGELRIYHLQGEGTTSPYLGQEVTVPGVVVADFQASDEMEGFFMQDPSGDGNPSTSDGIFVYSTEAVNEGDWVEVTGLVDEYNHLTQVDTVSAVSVISTGNTIAPTSITFPEQTNGEIERYEGMLVTIPHTMTVEQNYFQGRYGQVTLASGDRMYQPTHLHEPGSPEYWDQVDENARRLLVLDDGSSDQNPDPIPYIGLNDTLRAGDVVSAGLTGVIDNGPINSSSPPAIDYRLHPTEPVEITRVNERSVEPAAASGRLRVASFNVLNYFTTFGSRGADNQEEFDRQRDKIITAMLTIDADIFGLMEIENNGYEAGSAIVDLVSGLNDIAGAGTYAFIDPGVDQIGTDVIAVGLIYRPSSVTPAGAAAILDDTFDPDYYDDYNRPALAQTFDENETGARFTVVVNHLKSKGSPCDAIGDPNVGDGQGNCNLTRTSAMTVELQWLATDPTDSGDPDFLIIGDLNSYAQEDPIEVARNNGYTDLLDQYVGAGAYSYIFDGASGYLDYGLANGSMASQVTGASTWQINADEPSVIDYNTDYKTQDLYTDSPYRSSDHDPVIVDLNLVHRLYLPIIIKSPTPKQP
jgi:uncharacterized repeat protein (TIGR01451 family)